jgi:tetratricopeptide (TPR) repeat protein
VLEARLLDATGRHQEAAEAAKRWMAFALEARDHALVAQAALVRADAMATLGHLDESGKLYRRARRSAEKVGDEVLLGRATLGLGHVEYYLGQRERSRERYKRAYALFDRLGRPRELATTLWSLGFVETWRGKLDTAEALFKRMLQLAQAERDRRTEADAENALGELARREDDIAAARAHYEAAVRIARASGYAKQRIYRINLAHTELALGKVELAERLVETVGDELERAHDSIGASTARWIRAICAAERGDFVAFKEHRLRAMRLLGEHAPVDDDIASCAERAAEVAKRRGEYEEAVSTYRFARTLWQRLGHEHRVKACEQALVKMGQPIDAALSPEEETRLKATPKT